MVFVPNALFRHSLSFKGPICELARGHGMPSAQWADEYTILQPRAEYEMINGRIVVLYWGRPSSCDRILPTRASF